MARWTLAWAPVALALIACSPKESAVVVTHPNGLSLSISPALVVRERPTGFVVSTPDSASRRVPVAVELSLRAGPSPASTEGPWPESRDVAGRKVFYRIEESEGGSGGSSYTLRAWARHGSGHVLVEQIAQAEPPAKPEFSLAWTILEGLRPPP
ncbi:Tsi3 family protein [Sorangium sp. So ce296]|uniref:Tsi3 family protein n=1 Tax=Sorangium sp. So ce296 TaxID=3133296 RepID=UPI003F5E521A